MYLLWVEISCQGLLWQTFVPSLLHSTFSFRCLLSSYSSLLEEFVDLGVFFNLSVGARNFQTL